MKRTAEKVLGIIGICIDGLIGIGGLLLWASVYFSTTLSKSATIPIFDFIGEMILMFSYVILIIAAISLICVILALFAVKKLKDNPKLSGYLFLIAAAVSGFVYICLAAISLPVIPIQTIIYLIVGILCLLGNSKREPVIKYEDDSLS